MSPNDRVQVYANALKLFDNDSTVTAQAVKSLAMLDVLPDKMAFDTEGYIIFSAAGDLSTYVQLASEDGRPLRVEVSSQPRDTNLTPVQQRTLRRYGFTIAGGSETNPHQDWPRARMEELPGWIERVFRDVYGLPEDGTIVLAGGV